MEEHSFFSKMVDEIVNLSEQDPELADGIKWLDEQAQKKGITFYDMVADVLYNYQTTQNTKQWLNNRN